MLSLEGIAATEGWDEVVILALVHHEAAGHEEVIPHEAEVASPLFFIFLSSLQRHQQLLMAFMPRKLKSFSNSAFSTRFFTLQQLALVALRSSNSSFTAKEASVKL